MRNLCRFRAARDVCVSLWVVKCLVACAPAPGPVLPPANMVDTRIDVPQRDADDVVANPEGDGDIIAGEVLVDFEDDLSDSEIDATLAANNLERVGILGDVNVVVARILDGRTEPEVRDALRSEPGVEAAVLNHIIPLVASAGAVEPVYDPRGSGPKDTLSQAELKRNWPHYVMDTLPALALADEVLEGRSVPQVVLAVVDSGFQQQIGTSPSDTSESILSPASGDTDLVSKVVDPTGYDFRIGLLTGTQPRMFAGPVEPASHALIASRASFHGLQVPASAVGGGQDLIGTSRHVKLRPVRWTLDPTVIVPGSRPIMSTDYLVGALKFLADENSPSLKVINLSVGMEVGSEQELVDQQQLFAPHLDRLVAGGRIVVVAAGNLGAPTDISVLPSLGPTRDSSITPRRGVLRAPAHAGMLVVGGTALPEFVPSSLPRDLFQIIGALFGRPSVQGDLVFSGQTERYMSVSFSDLDFTVFGNHGPHVHVSAPGAAVPGLQPDLTSIEPAFGTSLSAPYVAGIAAEMFALDPSASNVDIIEMIQSTADDVDDPGPDDRTGFGRVNGWKAFLTLLNRTDPSNPTRLGIRFLWNLPGGPPDSVLIAGQTVPMTNPRIVSGTLAADQGARVPWGPPAPAAWEIDFSIDSEALDAASVDLLEVRTGSGTPMYQIPARFADLFNARVADSSVDDYVVTLDVQNVVSSIHGRVTSEGRPVEGAEVRYVNRLDGQGTVLSDADGFYAVYDAKPDSVIEISAGADGLVREAEDITTQAFRAVEHDFALMEAPETVPFVFCTWSGPSGTCFPASTDCDLQNGSVLEVTVDPFRPLVPEFRLKEPGLVHFFLGFRVLKPEELDAHGFGSYDIIAPFDGGRYTAVIQQMFTYGDYTLPNASPNFPGMTPVPAIPLEQCREITIVMNFVNDDFSSAPSHSAVILLGTDDTSRCFLENSSLDDYTPIPGCP